jgi:hypothetical protein
MLLLLLVLVGVFVAPLLGFVVLTVTACARLENAIPVKITASGNAASHDCGLKKLVKLFTLVLFHADRATVAFDILGSIGPIKNPAPHFVALEFPTWLTRLVPRVRASRNIARHTRERCEPFHVHGNMNQASFDR